MAAELALIAIVVAAISGLPAAMLPRERTWPERFAVVALALATVLGVAAAAVALVDPGGEPLWLVWPGGSFHVEVDAISAVFLIQIFALALLGAIFGLGYWPQRENTDNGRKLRLSYGLMVAGMALLVIARNAILFMIGWELMALAAFVAVTTEDRIEAVRQVGYVYLVATRIASLSLIAMFTLIHHATGDWELIGTIDANGSTAAAIFILALIGFGLKAGIMPLHVWLPGAHANAPSHVSALMSGVLIKMGIYGLIRTTSMFPDPPLWWGGTLLMLGLVSGVIGVAFAIAQHDLKRLLAYHSVENIGIICMGLGVALIGRASGHPTMVALGIAGALLHTFNHGLFKALLFLSAGSVIHATGGEREIDRLGGVLHRMRWTALWFLVGAVAICGLPPLNGFVSELLVYLGFIDIAATHAGSLWLAGAFSAALLALVGALAVACFVKVFGAVFLGEPRAGPAANAHEAPRSMLAPMAILAAMCVAIGIAAPLVAPVLDGAAVAWSPELAARIAPVNVLAPLDTLVFVYLPLVALGVVVARWLIVRTRGASHDVGTWDCGYVLPTARMQYTSSSFAQMLVGMFAWALRPKVEAPHPSEPFPVSHAEHFGSHVADAVLEQVVMPAGKRAGGILDRLRRVQGGRPHAYILYILITLIVLLLWKGG